MGELPNELIPYPHLPQTGAAKVRRRRRGDKSHHQMPSLLKSGGHKTLPLPDDFCRLWYTFAFLKRNSKAFSVFWKISETIRASDFKIYHKAALILFTFRPEMTSSTTLGRKQSVQTRLFWIMFGSRFLDNGSTNSKKVYSSGNCDSRTHHFFFCNILDVFAP